ncbi:MAG: hypothetical protein HW421_63 [Ignavibacteria bacterium]|nr:hypothetical protein [Ignavibacteria bacterium]
MKIKSIFGSSINFRVSYLLSRLCKNFVLIVILNEVKNLLKVQMNVIMKGIKWKNETGSCINTRLFFVILKIFEMVVYKNKVSIFSKRFFTSFRMSFFLTFQTASFAGMTSLLVVFVVLLHSCKTVVLPPVEQSLSEISFYEHKSDSLRKIVAPKSKLSSGSDLYVSISKNAINRFANSLANNRIDDLNVNFLPKQSFISEDKSFLGVKYTNYMNIDTGYVSLDLKKLNFNKIEGKTIEAGIELEGKGFIKISGKYAGVPASVKPDVELYLNENISFNILPGENGSAVLKPNPKKILLKTKFSIKLLEWKLPWYHEVPLELMEILKPIVLPVGINTGIMLPLPAKTYGSKQIEYVPYRIEFVAPTVFLKNDKIEYTSNINLYKK